MNRLLKVLSENVYPHLSVQGQNLLVSTYGLVYRRHRLGGQFRRIVEDFRIRDRWPEERMRNYLERALREMVAHAWEHVPYYRRAWTAAGLDAGAASEFRLCDLRFLSVTPKSDLRIDPESFLASGELSAESPIYESTSGSTGESVTVTSTASLQQAFQAAREARSFHWAGTSVLLPRATIGGRMIVPWADSPGPYYRYNRAERQCYLSAFHISPDTVSDYLKGLHRHRSRVLTGYASSFFSLARMMLAQGLELEYRPDALILCADKLTKEMKAVIRDAFHARPYEEYGSVENAALATECEHGRLHVNSDFGLIEIVDDMGRPLPPGEEGRILCTSLLNRVQPLIRYDVGDLGVWSKEPCPCGRTQLPVLREVVGREEDTVIGPDGREIVRICSLQGVPHVIASQVVQEQLDLVKVRVIAAEGFNESDERTIEKIIATTRLGNVRVKVEQVSDLERTHRGKVRRVICRISARQEAMAGERA